ncbi:MAG: FYDLN acid domain-containing protein [Lachnospiraceae bacterium]|nr:FYDLN acid domain-containing protein [Lachnospiraceae bacterium]
MYFVPDGTKLCGFYECIECKMRFLDVRITPTLVCPYCGEEVDMEVGPDEELPVTKENAKLLDVIRDEDVEKMDTLLSLALTGGDFEWI